MIILSVHYQRTNLQYFLHVVNKLKKHSINNRSDRQVVSGKDCSVNDSGSLPTRDTDCKVFSAMQGH